MNRLLVVTGAFIGVLTIASCNFLGTPTPTPDVPRFTEGEAIAMVKTWLGGKTFTPNPRMNCLYARVIAENIEDHYSKPAVTPTPDTPPWLRGDEPTPYWRAIYIGDGRWSVTAISLNSALGVEAYSDNETAILKVVASGGSWLVYEESGTVVSHGTAYSDYVCR